VGNRYTGREREREEKEEAKRIGRRGTQSEDGEEYWVVVVALRVGFDAAQSPGRVVTGGRLIRIEIDSKRKEQREKEKGKWRE
jgi:hypothetical protein